MSLDEAKQKLELKAKDNNSWFYSSSANLQLVTLNDAKRVLGDLQKTHILIEKEKLRQRLVNHDCELAHPVERCLYSELIRELLKEKAEKLLEPQK